MQNSLSQTDAPSWESMDDRSTLLKAVRSNPGHESAPRKRNPLACEWCYRKKVKCELEGSNTACVQCMRRNIKCKFTTRREKREAHRRTQYVRSLEERLRRTETVLRAAGILDEAAINQEELYDDDELLESSSEVENDDDELSSASPNLSRAQNGNPRRLPSSDRGQASNGLKARPPLTRSARNSQPSAPCNSDLQQIPVFKMDHREESRYYGRASSLSILSREGIEWIGKKTGDTKFLNFICSSSSRDCPWDYWRADVFHDLFSSQVFKSLPPRADVFALVKNYFRTSNRLFPLYHEESFMRLVEWQYTQQTCNDAAWWASINIILALAYEYRLSDNVKPDRDREKSWQYFKNAMSVFSELTLRRTDLLSVQALLGLAFFLRGNSGTQTALPIVTAAMRSCHRMGLHRDIPRPHLPRVELEQRRRVFWIAYVLDQSTCVRAGSAPAQHVDDFDVDLPEVDPGGSSFFRQLCCLTILKSRVYARLYSARGLQKTPEEVCQVVKGLHAEFEEWRKANPFDNSKLQQVADDGFLMGFASVGLQLVYYNSLIMIHRMPLILYHYARYLESESAIHFDPSLFGEQSLTSAAVCVQAARNTLKLVNSMPWGDIAWIWSLLYYVFLAVMTLFVNILRDPRNRKAREDLQSLNMAATFFTSLMPGDSPCNYAKFMATMCTNFERVARMLVEREEKTIKDRQPTEKQQPPRPLRRTTHHHPRHPDPQPPSQPGPSPGIGIPNLEGFPPINSSGYVVPRSPSISTNPSSTNINSPLNVPPAGIQPSPPGDPNPPNPPPFPLDNVFSTDPSSSAPSLPFPEFWQIPLTADWEFGNQFLGGFFAHNSASASSSACQYQQQQQQQPFLPAFSQGYFFDCSNPDSVPGQDSNLDSNMWSGSF